MSASIKQGLLIQHPDVAQFDLRHPTLRLEVSIEGQGHFGVTDEVASRIIARGVERFKEQIVDEFNLCFDVSETATLSELKPSGAL